jgi:hypothetical protein
MGCRKVWDREHLVSVMPKSLVSGELRKHREEVLFDREKAMLPDTMAMVNAEKHARALVVMTKELKQTITEMEQTINNNLVFIDRVKRAIDNGDAPPEYVEIGGGPKRPAADRGPSIVCRCPATDCRGFVGSNMACGICEAKVCKECHELVDVDGEHECKPENVESAKLIAKSTKPCPKCSVPIFKIDGCDQMWCTQCKTAFSWRTCQIEVQNVHNPHYYEWMRNQGGGHMPRAEGDIPMLQCGGLVPYANTIQWLRTAECMAGDNGHMRYRPRAGVPNARRGAEALAVEPVLPQNQLDVGELISGFHRIISHCQNVELTRYRVRPGRTQNARLRVSYMMNEIDEANFKRQAVLKERSIEKQNNIFQVMEMFVTVGSDLCRNYVRGPPTKEAAYEFLKELQELKTYTNGSFKRIAKQFDSMAPLITLSGCESQHAKPKEKRIPIIVR